VVRRIVGVDELLQIRDIAMRKQNRAPTREYQSDRAEIYARSSIPSNTEANLITYRVVNLDAALDELSRPGTPRRPLFLTFPSAGGFSNMAMRAPVVIEMDAE
jgi:hypothetical protein